jgi:hypothetical protein
VAGNPRNGRPYRRLCAWLRAQRLPCWICGHNIGYELNARQAVVGKLVPSPTVASRVAAVLTAIPGIKVRTFERGGPPVGR